jgi:hypothetical protein
MLDHKTRCTANALTWEGIVAEVKRMGDGRAFGKRPIMPMFAQEDIDYIICANGVPLSGFAIGHVLGSDKNL